MVNLMNRHNLSTSSSDPAGVSGAAASSRTVRSTVFFLAKLCALFVALLFLFGKGIMPQYLYSYNAYLLDKMERLTSLTEPKIVLISNSNLAFGMDCSLLEEAFQMPVVNAGVHGGLGNAFQEEIAKVNITEGDLIIVCHTDYDDDDTIVDPVIAWLTVENHPELWRLIRRKDIPDMYFSFPDYAKRVISLWTSKEGNVQDHGTVYSRLAFNEYGDVSFERPKPQYEKEEFFELFTLHAPAVEDVCIDRLNALNQYVTERGAVMLVAGFPVMDCAYTPPVEDYIRFQTTLEERLDCPVISDCRDYFLDYEYFYDTPYHLTNEGAKLRTRQLILDLRRYLESQERSTSPSS